MFLEKIFKLSFFSFLFTSTFSWINFFLWNENSYISWNFSKFSSLFFSLSDLFLFLSVFLFFIFLYKKNFHDKKKFFWKWEDFLENFRDKNFNLLFLILIWITFLTSFFTENFSNFLLHFSIFLKFFSAWFLLFYIPEKIFSKKEILNTLIFSFVIQWFIAFYQVISQKPVWLFFLWENNFWENILWLAKIWLENWKDFIRWYWTLDHPNILWLWSLTLYFLSRKSDYFFLKNFLLIWIFFSFSKTAIIWFFVLKIYEIFILEKKSWKTETGTQITEKIKNIFSTKTGTGLNYKNIFYKFFYSFILISIFYFFHKEFFLRFQNFFWTSFSERITQLEISKNIFLENFFWIWFWNFQIVMQNFSDKILKPWEIQPVHNFFVLFWTEIWILWFLSLVVFISYIFINSTSFFNFFTKKEKIENQNHEKFFLILILFFASFFDHFLLTSWIWIILFWLILKKIKD